MEAINSLHACLRFFTPQRPPPLALSAAGPSARIMAEASKAGYMMSASSVHIHRTSDHEDVRDDLDGEHVRDVRIGDNDICAIQYMMWWLQRRNSSIPLVMACNGQHLSEAVVCALAGRTVRLHVRGSDLISSEVHLPSMPQLRAIRLDLLVSAVHIPAGLSLDHLQRVMIARLSPPSSSSTTTSSSSSSHVSYSPLSSSSEASPPPSALGWLSRCPNLKELRLDNCGGGRQDFTPLTHATQLQFLTVKWANTVDLEWLRPLQHLVALTMSHCNVLSDDWSPVGGHQHLSTLSLSGSNVSELSWLKDCPLVQDLSCGDGCPQLHDCGPLVTLRALASLKLSYYAIRSDLRWIQGCAQLEVLRLDWVSSLVDWNALAVLYGLRELHCTKCTMSSALWLSSCKALEEVHLDATSLPLDEWHVLAELPLLRVLSLLRAGALLQSMEWIAACGALEVVELRTCPFIKDLAPLNALPKLRSLSTNIKMDDTERRSALRGVCDWLNASFDVLTLILPTSGFQLCAASLTSLSVVDLSDNKSVGDASPLRHASHLRVFKASRSTISSIQWIQSCTALEELYLHDCNHLHNWQPIAAVVENLRVLIASCNDHVGSLPWGRSFFYTLERLDVSGCPPPAVPWFTVAARMPKLRTLRVSHLGDDCISYQAWVRQCPCLDKLELRVWEPCIEDYVTTLVLPQQQQQQRVLTTPSFSPSASFACS